MQLNILTICYLVGAVTFILGLKMLSNPATARKGNQIAGAGMMFAILGTIFLYRDDEGNRLHNYGWIFGGIIIGGIIGTLAAKKVKMTAMPEMVSLFNGMGGACAALISIVEFGHFSQIFHTSASVFFSIKDAFGTLLTICAGALIGSVSFAGSVIAWGKLNGKIKDYSFKGQHIFNLTLLGIILCIIIYLLFFINFQTFPLFYLVPVLSIFYGILFVLPIGGADMPVVISLLNSFTGVAA